MSKIKSILAFVAVLLCGGAWAAAPVVWWSGDFGTSAKVGTDGVTYVLNPNGNTVDSDGNLVIDSTAGGGYGALVKCAEGDFGQSVSVLIKYSGLVAPTDTCYSLFGLRDTATANNGLGTGVGVRLNGNGAAKVACCIEGGNLNSTALATHASSGYMLICYSTQSGIAVFSGSDLASLSGGAGSGLHYSNLWIKTLGIGGPVSSTTYPSWNNLKIEEVAIFRNTAAVSSFSNSSSLTTTYLADMTKPELGSTDAFMFNKYLTSEWQDTGYNLDDINKLAKMTFSGEMAGANMSSKIFAASGWFVTKQSDDTVTFEMQAFDNGYVKLVPVSMKIENGTVRIKGGVNTGDNKLASYFNQNKPLGTRAYTVDFSARNTGVSAANLGSAINATDSYSVASVFARTTGPTLPVAPVATWTDFTGTANGVKKNGVTVNANGNSVAADGITIDGSTGGATVTFDSACHSATVVVKYTGAITAETFGLVAMKSGSTEGGIWYDNDTSKLRGYWGKDWTGGDVLGSVPSGENEEHTLVYSYGRNKGYVVAGSWVTIDGRVVYGTGSLTGADATINSFSIGGFSGTTKALASGMKIKSITVYDTAVKTDETNVGQFLKYWYEFNGNLNKSGRDGVSFGGEQGANTDYTSCGDGQAYVIRAGAAHPYGTLTLPSDGYTVVSRIRSVATDKSILWSLGNTAADNKAIGLVSRGSDKVAFFEYDGSSVTYKIDDVSVANSTTLYHDYAVTVSGTKVELFVDGVSKGTTTLSIAPTAKFQWGSVHGGTVTGLTRTTGVAIDDWKLYDTVLNANDIASMAPVATTPDGTKYETIAAALAAALADKSLIVTILDGTTTLPEGYTETCVIENGQAWAKREVYARNTNPYSYHTSNDSEENTKVELRTGDTILLKQQLWQSGRWTLSNLDTNYPIKVQDHTDIDSIPEDADLSIEYKNYPESGDKQGIYLRGNIGANAQISGTGALFLGFTDNSTIADGVTISCEVGFQSSGKHQTLVADATLTLECENYNHVSGSSIKLNSGAKIISDIELPEGAVESNVAEKIVGKEQNSDDKWVYTLKDPPPVATVVIDGETQNFTTLSAALSAAGTAATAQNQKTVTLLANAENVDIPANVVLDVSSYSVVGTITGSGTLMLPLQTLPAEAMATELQKETWEGTLFLRDCGNSRKNTHGYVPMQTYGNANSKIKLSGWSGYTAVDQTFPGTLVLEDGTGADGNGVATDHLAADFNNGNGNTYFKFAKLEGDGTLIQTAGTSGNPGTCDMNYMFGDVSKFTGSVTMSGYRPISFVFGDRAKDRNTYRKMVHVAPNTTAQIAEGKSWNALGGIVIDGTISGVGTVGSVTFGNDATIDVTDNEEGKALTLAEGATVTFGNTLNLDGAKSGSVIMKGITTRPDVEFITVKIGGENAVGHLAYDSANQAIIYTEETSDYWMPKASGEGERNVFTWKTGSAWTDYNGQDAEWPSTGMIDGEKINVKIDAKDFAGVVIEGQVIAGDVVVECSDGENHDFEFHNPTQTVDGESEVDETNKLTANSILMPQHRGNLGLKVPIDGEIGFSTNTHLVFRTGTGSNISEAYTYNVNTHDAAIVVDLTNGEAGKFEVPSSMYAQKFEVKENATIVFKSTSIDITGVYSGAGKLAKMGEGTTALVSVNLPSGGVEVLEGTLKLNRGSTNYPFWNGTALPVMVADGATLDINGCEGFKSAITLEEGATLASDDAGRDLGYENASIYSISLNGNATVRAVGDFGILRNQRGDTSFALNGHKLTKTGAGIFHLCNTTVSSDSTGSIDVQAGRLAIWNKAVNVSSVDVAFADGTSLAMSANLTAHDITITGAVTITSDSTGTLSGSSIKLMTAESTLTVPTKLADDAVTTDLTGKIVVFNETTLQYSVSDAYVEKAFESVVGSSASGWFDDWGGEKDGAARSVITGSGLEQKRMVHHDGDDNAQKWHPYYGLSSKNAYTMSVYGTTDLIEPEAGKYKVLWAMGNPGNSHILAKDEDGNIVFFKNSNGSGNTGTQSNKISAGKLSGYHLITVTFSTTQGAAIWVDGEKKASDSTFTTAANTGLQVGGVYQGTYSPMKQGVGYVPTYIWAAEAVAPDAQIVTLSAAHPAVTTFNANVVFETNGGKVYLPSMTNTSGNLFQVKKGTLVVPKDATATLDNIEFGDSQGSSYGLELDGSLTINKSSTDSCTDASVYRNNSQNNGVLFGEWEGTGTYNIRGTFSAPNAWVDLIHDAGNQTFNVNGGTFTVKGLTAKKAGATINLTNGGTLNLGSNPSMESIRIIKNLTNGTVNGNGAEYDTLNVTGAVSLKYGSQNIRSLNIANGGTATLVTNGDQLNYGAIVAHVKGTLDCGSTRQTLFDGSKIYLYNGGTITGAGGSNNGVTVGLDTDRDGAGVIISKNADVDTKVATITGSLGAHDGNTGSNTITVQEGAEDVILSIPNAASLNGRMAWVIGEGVNVKFGAEKAIGSYTSLTINGNVVIAEEITDPTTIVTAAEGQTIALGAGVKAVDPSLNELTRTVLAVEGLSLVAKTGETLMTIDGAEYVSIDNALKHLHQDSTVVLGTGVTLEDGLIKHGEETFNPLDYLGYEIVVDEESGAMTANRVFEGAGDISLVISEIMPKASAWDENHKDAGWLELHNTGSKWVNFGEYKIGRYNRGKAVKVTDWSNGVTLSIAPGARLIVKTSEDYSAKSKKTIVQYGEDLGNAIVFDSKVNPKKYPLVVLIKGGKVVQNCVVPVDVPEDKSVCYDGELKNGAVASYITTASKGEASNFTGAVAVGPQISSLYAVKDAVDPWQKFKKATIGEAYPITVPVNPIMDGNANNEIASVKLIYRIDFGAEVVVETPMTKSETKDSKNGYTYTGEIPGSAITTAGQLVRWAVQITDVGGNVWRAPSFNNGDDGYEYFGTIVTPSEEQLSGGLNTWHLFADPDEVADGIGTANKKGEGCLMNRDADASNFKTTRHPNGGRVGIYDMETGLYYDNVRIDKRGRTTGAFTKKAHGLKFSKSQPFTGTDSLTGESIECRKSSLTAEYGDPTFIRQELAFEVLRRNGVKVPFHYPVRVNLNGQFYQLAFHSERFSDELIEDFYGLDPKGYGYKNVGTFHNGTNNSSERKTPDDGSADLTVNDPVLRAFCDTLNGVNNIGEGTDFAANPTYSADVSKVVTQSFDLPAWLNYIAATKITAETDDSWANLSGYYDINGTGTWMPLAYDMNQSLGQWHFADDRARGRIGLVADKDDFKSHPFYGGLHIRMHNNAGSASGNPNYAYEAIFQNAKFRRLYLRRLRTLMDKEIGEKVYADQASEKSALFTSAAQMVAAINELGLKDRSIWTDYANVDFAGNTDCSSNGSCDKIWVWPQSMTEQLSTPEGGLKDLWDNYIAPRRAYLYGKHLASNGEVTVGYGLNLSAGIPAAQTDIATLKGTDENPKITARYDATLGTVIIENDNEETIDLSGWKLTGPVTMTIPEGTVLDQKVGEVKGQVYFTANRKATIEAFGANLADQIVVGNGAANGAETPISLRTPEGMRVVGEPTAQELNIRFDAFYGSTLGDGDENEWFSIKNIGEEAVEYTGMTVCILKDGDGEEKDHCHVTLPEGTLEAGASKKFAKGDFAAGFVKIQNNVVNISVYDMYMSPVQKMQVTQKDYTWAYQHGAYLEHQTDSGKWHQVWDSGDLVLADYLSDKGKNVKALAKDLYVRASEPTTITLDNPSFDKSATLKISGEGKVTITGTLNATVNTTAIKSTGDLVFSNGSYTITAGDDCIQADGDITINGGTFYCHSTGNDGIDSNKNIVINGGTIFAFTAATEDDNAKSTGLDVNSGNSITINGGTVIATSASTDALLAMTVNGKHQVVEVSEVSGATKAIADVIVTFPEMDPVPTAVLVSTPNLTDETITPADPDTVELVAEDAEAGTDAVQAKVPASWVSDKEGDAKKAAAEAFVLGLAAPTAGAVVSAKETGAENTLKIVDNVLPRVGTGVTVERKLKVGTTVGELSEDTTATYSDGFEIQLPTGGDKVKYIKIEYIFK